MGGNRVLRVGWIIARVANARVADTRGDPMSPHAIEQIEAILRRQQLRLQIAVQLLGEIIDRLVNRGIARRFVCQFVVILSQQGGEQVLSSAGIIGSHRICRNSVFN